MAVPPNLGALGMHKFIERKMEQLAPVVGDARGAVGNLWWVVGDGWWEVGGGRWEVASVRPLQEV